jgi:hypothetical protein
MLDEVNEEDAIEILGYQGGGRVRETGIALVHEGEYIVPAPGSEAQIEPTEAAEQAVVNYYFPVEIVIVGSLPEEERQAIETRIWEKLSDALEETA